MKEKKKILIVEDNPVSHRALSKILQNNNFEVFSAWSASEAFAQIKNVQPDAICMDVILPDKDGITITRELQGDAQTSAIPVIFVTNKVMLKDDKGNEVFEIDGVLHRAFAKPFHPQKIISVITKEINRRHSGGALPKKIQEFFRKKDDVS